MNESKTTAANVLDVENTETLKYTDEQRDAVETAIDEMIDWWVEYAESDDGLNGVLSCCLGDEMASTGHDSIRQWIDRHHEIELTDDEARRIWDEMLNFAEPSLGHIYSSPESPNIYRLSLIQIGEVEGELELKAIAEQSQVDVETVRAILSDREYTTWNGSDAILEYGNSDGVVLATWGAETILELVEAELERSHEERMGDLERAWKALGGDA